MNMNDRTHMGQHRQATAELSPEEQRLLRASRERTGRSRGNPLELNVEALEDRVAPATGPNGILAY